MVYDIISRNSIIGRQMVFMANGVIRSNLSTHDYRENVYLEYSMNSLKPLKSFYYRSSPVKSDYSTCLYCNSSIRTNCNGKEKNAWFNGVLFDNIQIMFQLPRIYELTNSRYARFKTMNVFAPYFSEVFRIVVTEVRQCNERKCYQIRSPLEALFFYDNEEILLSCKTGELSYCLVAK